MNKNLEFVIKNGGVTITKCNKNVTEVVIPSEIGGYPVTSISEYAFSGCNGLTSITIPNSVTYIGDSAFSGCNGLVSITIPNSVTYIGQGVFSSCTDLKTVKLSRLSKISIGMFSDCWSLKSIDVPNSVKEIECWGFRNCESLKSIDIPNSVESIEMGAFNGCKLKITIPKNLHNKCKEVLKNLDNCEIVCF